MMTSRVTEEGQIVLSESVARQLGVRSGDVVDIEVEENRVVLTPSTPPRRGKAQIITDPITGFPVLTMGPDSPIMTSEQVEEMLADFP